jgi:adenylate cyclase
VTAAAPRLAGSLAAKWTLAIALLLVLGMGLLGAYLIGQQERTFDEHSRRLGELLADQLARSASEPLLAEDGYQLELLVRRQLDEGLVVGAAVLDSTGQVRAEAGTVPGPGRTSPHRGTFARSPSRTCTRATRYSA